MIKVEVGGIVLFGVPVCMCVKKCIPRFDEFRYIITCYVVWFLRISPGKRCKNIRLQSSLV